MERTNDITEATEEHLCMLLSESRVHTREPEYMQVNRALREGGLQKVSLELAF